MKLITVLMSPFMYAIAQGAPLFPEVMPSCPEKNGTLSDLAKHFPPGETKATLGKFEIFARQRTCNDLTGCGGWKTAKLSASGDLGGVRTPIAGGTLNLSISDNSIYVHIEGDKTSMPGYGPEAQLFWAGRCKIAPGMEQSFDCQNGGFLAALGPIGKGSNRGYYSSSSVFVEDDFQSSNIRGSDWVGSFGEKCLQIHAEGDFRDYNNYNRQWEVTLLFNNFQ